MSLTIDSFIFDECQDDEQFKTIMLQSVFTPDFCHNLMPECERHFGQKLNMICKSCNQVFLCPVCELSRRSHPCGREHLTFLCVRTEGSPKHNIHDILFGPMHPCVANISSHDAGCSDHLCNHCEVFDTERRESTFGRYLNIYKIIRRVMPDELEEQFMRVFPHMYLNYAGYHERNANRALFVLLKVWKQWYGVASKPYGLFVPDRLSSESFKRKYAEVSDVQSDAYDSDDVNSENDHDSDDEPDSDDENDY